MDDPLFACISARLGDLGQPRWRVWLGLPGLPYPSGAASAAVTTAAVAAVAQVATGCKFQGCPYGSYCNTKTGFCEARKCGEGLPWQYDLQRGPQPLPRPLPRPRPPNDFLPQDNRLENFSPVGRPQ